jgi:hypothetical protein
MTSGYKGIKYDRTMARKGKIIDILSRISKPV